MEYIYFNAAAAHRRFDWSLILDLERDPECQDGSQIDLDRSAVGCHHEQLQYR